MKQYNVEIQPLVENLIEYNELENRKRQMILDHGGEFYAAVKKMEEDGTLKEYHAINHSMTSGANNQEWNAIIMRLYELGYSNAQLPSRYELNNYHDYMDGITIDDGRIER